MANWPTLNSQHLHPTLVQKHSWQLGQSAPSRHPPFRFTCHGKVKESQSSESTFPNALQKFNLPHASLFVLVYGGEHLRSQCDTADSPRFMEFLQVPLPPPAVQRLLLMRASWLPKSPITPASLLGCFL